jgi:hypothetical protein
MNQRAAGERLRRHAEPLPSLWETRGAVKQNDESDVHLQQPPKQSSYLLHFVLFLFLLNFYQVLGRFITRELKNTQKSTWAHHKKCGFFSSGFFVLPRFFARFFYRVFWRFVTRGVQKRGNSFAAAKKSSYLSPRPFFSFF